jgi:acetyltransferase-like isoleucine patch superfamily enzyme
MISFIQLLFTLALYLLGAIVIGTAAFPGVMLVRWVVLNTAGMVLPLRFMLISITGAAAYFIYGICLIFLVAALRFVLRLDLKEGEYKIPSAGAAKWAFANSLVLLVSVTFMDFMLLTPLITFFYRLMGAKVGKNVQINSKNCADLSLLEIGDGAVIGGHATVIGHSVERGRIILKKVKIGPNVVVGLNSVVLPGSELGKRSMLAAGTVLQKDAQVGDREVYFGVPAQSLRERRAKEEILKRISEGGNGNNES